MHLANEMETVDYLLIAKPCRN